VNFRKTCIAFGAAVLAAPLLLQAASAAEEQTIQVDGVERRFIVDAGGGGPKPLIVALHGGGGSADGFWRRSGLREAALDAGFVIVFPDSDGGHWNDGRLTPRGKLVSVENDKEFLLSLVKRLVADRVADPKRIYITGHSNGGMMSFAMACHHPKIFRGMAPVSANVPLPMDCNTKGPIAILNIVGLQDRVVPFEGGGIFGRLRRGQLLSVDETWNRLLQKNVCKGAGDEDRGGAVVLRGNDCAQQTFQVRLKRQGHSWPQDEVGTIVKFFAGLK
jgi:polyhydroxybutyrate depolymerase